MSAPPGPSGGARPQSRHPSARAVGGQLEAPVRRLLRGPAVAAVSGAITGPHRAVAVAALAVRGGQHRTRSQFAAAYGLAEAEVAHIETGEVALEHLPAVLRVLTPLASVAQFGLALGPPVVGLARR
jgi:hypothetical protein